MARQLRILLAGGWYHVSSRGNRREALFLDDADRRRFLGLVAELPERFGLEIHAFVLMSNHYHLLVRTPEPNLSHAIRWLNVSYSSRFNWAHRQCGHVFQGRFKAIVIEDQRGVVAVARYVHLNPVRVGALGLGKAEQRRAKRVGCVDPGAELIARRLAELRTHPWSSWRVYSGAEAAPSWLETGTIAAGCGGRSRAERREALRDYTETPVRQGRLESPWAGLVGGLVLGGTDFAKRLLEGRPVDAAEQTEARRLQRSARVDWRRIVGAAEELRRRPWKEMLEVHGDWGRDGTIYVAVRHGGHRLAEVVRSIPGLKYQAAAQAVKRFRESLEKHTERTQFVDRMRRRLSKI